MKENSMCIRRFSHKNRQPEKNCTQQKRTETNDQVSPTDVIAWPRITGGDYSYIIFGLEKPTYVPSGSGHMEGCDA